MSSRSMVARGGGAEVLFAALGIALVIAVGALIGVQGMQALLLVGVGAAALLIFLQPLYGMLLMAASIPLQSMFLIGQEVTATRMLGIAVAGAWVLQKLLRREPWGQLVTMPFVITAVLFSAYVLASLLWAVHPRLVASGFIQLAQLLLWSAIIIDLAGSWRRTDLLTKALVFGAILAALFTIQQFYAGTYRRAGEDIAGGINNTAVVLVTLLPFGFYLFRSQQSLLWRILGCGYVGLAVVAVVVTFSRMNMLLLPPLLLVLVAETLWSGRGRRLATALAVGMAAVAVFTIPWDLVLQRAETIAPYLETTIEHGEPGQPTASGRGYHLKVGLAIFRDHPILGAGYLNYGRLFLDRYQFEVAGAPKLYDVPRSPHSSHFGILADLGLAGTLLWILMLSTVLYACLRAWRRTRHDGWSDRRIYAHAITYAVLLQIFAYGMYLPNQREKIFWTVLGMAVVVPLLVQRRGVHQGVETEDAAPPPEPPVEPAPAPVRPSVLVGGRR